MKKLIHQILISLFFSFILSTVSTISVAAKEGDPNQLDFALLSDSHVDYHPHNKPTDLNPSSVDQGKDLDGVSFENLINKLNNKLPLLEENPSFAIILGDLPTHHTSGYRSNYISKTLRILQDKLSTAFFYGFGNNDSLERDYGHFKYNGNSVYEILKKITGHESFLSSGEQCPFIGKPCIIEQNVIDGYYSAYIADHLKLLMLNSVMFCAEKKDHIISRDGDKQQLAWLTNELKMSQENTEQVILAMHVSPNTWKSDSEKNYILQFKNIINAYPHVVIAILAAHTHTNQLHAIKSITQTIPVIYSAGFAPVSGNSSSFKTVSLTRDTPTSPWSIKNFSTYYFHGHEADEGSIEKLYDFNNAFCANSTANINACLNQIIVKPRHKPYVFNKMSSDLLKEYYYVNLNLPGKIATSRWVMNY